MNDVVVRFFSALVATSLSIFCFTIGKQFWKTLWWTFSHTIMIAEFAALLGLGVGTGVLHSPIYLMIDWNFPKEYIVGGFFVLFIYVLFFDSDKIREHMVFSIAHIWITYPCLIGSKLSQNSSFMIGFLCVVWFADAGAYFAGKLIGSTPLMSHISPRKTVEGTIGAIVTAQLVAYLASTYVTSLKQRDWLIISFIVGIFGQIGDLFESLFKRAYGKKDSGVIMPGHGGFLDRFDAVLFSLVFTDIYLKWQNISI